MPKIKELTPQRKELLATESNLLVLGGPGAGKTTIALLKADLEARSGKLKRGQRILFLSFARATIARVAQHAGSLICNEAKEVLEINTYHGFIWKLLQSHGYLLNAGGRIELLAPPQAAALLSEVTGEQARDAEKRRLFEQEGLLHFDLFAFAASELLSKSNSLRRIIGDAYPIIILDEFQDTNASEWTFIKTIGAHSRLIALADAEQRIYEFRGADPKRITEFTEDFHPTIYDFGTENYRSDGRDIIVFGNELLQGTNIGKKYVNVSIQRYGFYQGCSALFPLKASVLKRAKAMHKANPGAWSLAVLVPTKKLMIQVSDYLGSNLDRLPALRHDVALDTEAPALAAIVISALLEGNATASAIAQQLVVDLCQHIRGRRGNDKTPQPELQLAGALGVFLESGKVKGKNRLRIVDGAKNIAQTRLDMTLSGDPEADWLEVRRMLGESGVAEYQKVAEDAKYLRLLHKGATLRSRLSELWRLNGRYERASVAVRDALLQEHFSAGVRDWRGIHVMTIHKAKGKEFSEVIIFEGVHHGRIVRQNATANEIAQAKLALRVAATRAMSHTTVLTPKSDPCPFF